MREDGGSAAMLAEAAKYPANNPLPHSDPMFKYSAATDEDYSNRQSSSSAAAASSTGYSCEYPSCASGECSPYAMSPWNQSTSPYHSSPWVHHIIAPAGYDDHDHDHNNDNDNSNSNSNNNDNANNDDNGAFSGTSLIASLVREEGHIYSLAATGDVLYTGSDSKNIRVWRKQKDMAGFKCSSGLVKAIVIASDRIFTGHQDGKIRVWRMSPKNPAIHKRIGSLPRLKDFIRGSLNPSNYREVRRNRSTLWIRHSDAISCLSLTEDQGLLYSGSWDKTFKVWRIADSKCLESVAAHDDTVNSVVAAFGALVFTGSADGTVKVWRRELQGKRTKHVPVQTLLKQECAVTALVVSPTAPILYCGSSDGIVNFWEGERHLSHGGTLQGHKMAVLCLAAAGSLLLSGSADKTICVWRREGAAHSCLSVLTGHTGPIKCLAIVEDQLEGQQPGVAAPGSWIVYSGSLDKSVKMWRVSEEAPEALLRGPQHVPVA